MSKDLRVNEGSADQLSPLQIDIILSKEQMKGLLRDSVMILGSNGNQVYINRGPMNSNDHIFNCMGFHRCEACGGYFKVDYVINSDLDNCYPKDVYPTKLAALSKHLSVVGGTENDWEVSEGPGTMKPSHLSSDYNYEEIERHRLAHEFEYWIITEKE